MSSTSRSGHDYIESLRDGRAVYIDGERIGQHVDHPAFRNAVRTVAGLYDHQATNPTITMRATTVRSVRRDRRGWARVRTAGM